MDERKIILIQDLLDQRKRKEKELKFYLEKRDELEKKLIYLKHDLALTDHIIKLIETEKIEEIKI